VDPDIKTADMLHKLLAVRVAPIAVFSRLAVLG